LQPVTKVLLTLSGLLMSSKNSFRVLLGALALPLVEAKGLHRRHQREQIGLLVAERLERLARLRLGRARAPGTGGSRTDTIWRSFAGAA